MPIPWSILGLSLVAAQSRAMQAPYLGPMREAVTVNEDEERIKIGYYLKGLDHQVVKREDQGHGHMWLAPSDEEPETEREEDTDHKQYIWLGPSWTRPRGQLASGGPRSYKGGQNGEMKVLLLLLQTNLMSKMMRRYYIMNYHSQPNKDAVDIHNKSNIFSLLAQETPCQ